MDVTLKKANEHRNEWFEGVHKCKLDDTLYATMEKINRAEVSTPNIIVQTLTASIYLR